MQTIIMAGGLGTRLRGVVPDLPKPMLPVCGKSALERQIECLREQGLRDITLVTGYLGDSIQSYFGDGSYYGVSLSYYRETEPLGSGGALTQIELDDEFLLINGDVIFDVQFAPLFEFHRKTAAFATLVTHPNSHPYDSGLVVTDSGGKVMCWLHKEDERTIYHNRVNAGLHILSKRAIEPFRAQKRKIDLEHEILKPLVVSGRLYAYDTPEYIRDMGTPERYALVCSDVEQNKPALRSLRNKQKAIFLDRDGVINKHIGFLTRKEQFELLPHVAEAIRYVNELDYLAVVVTNQPVIARGECTLEELDEIHQLMEAQIGNDGAYIDALYFCPHHPDRGFEGERAEYKIDCVCRKPKPGMLVKAAEKYNIDLAHSYMVGDTQTDIETAKNAGVIPVLVGGTDYPTLWDFVKTLRKAA
jgi:D-glycero-D-manno-heptose 1,7-bisphosphate phosphatase